MPNKNEAKEGAFGLLQKYQMSKSLIGCYGSVVCAGTLSEPAKTTGLQWIAPALALVVKDHPSLCLLPCDNFTETAHFKVSKPFSINDMVATHAWTDALSLNDVLSRACDLDLVDPGTDPVLPPWRLQLYHGKPSLSGKGTDCLIVLAVHHVIMDGMSLSLFWQSLLSHLPNVTPLDAADAANLVIHPDNALAMTFSKPMEQFAGIAHPSVGDYAGVVGGLVGGLVKKVVLPASVRARAKVAAQQKSWQGDYQANPDIPHVTRTATTKVDLTRLVPLAKKNAVSVHALIHVAFLAAWAEQYKNRGVAMSTPVNCRSHATDQDLSKTLGNFVGVVSRSWSAAELQKMSSATSSFWQSVTLYHQHLQKGKQRSVVQVQFLNLLDYPHGYINDYWLDMRKKYEMKRQGGMEHSDLGRFPAPAPIDDADNAPWQLRDLWFQQSSQTFTTALGMQTITLGATLHAAFCWQKGSLDESLVHAVVDRFKAILDDLAA